MRLAVSNIGLPSFNHAGYFHGLRDFGFQGLEVAPSKIWERTEAVKHWQVQDYRRKVERCGLEVVGLHSLFFDQPGLNVFGLPETKRYMLDFLTQLSTICADLGGRTLVFGSPSARRRGDLSLEAADKIFVDFFHELTDLIADHGTVFVIEALGPSESDYINTVSHTLQLLNETSRPQLCGHLDAKSLCESGELDSRTISQASPTLAHVHVNEPGLGILERSKGVNHEVFGELLRGAGYDGWVSLEQRMLYDSNPMGPLAASSEIMRECYG